MVAAKTVPPASRIQKMSRVVRLEKPFIARMITPGDRRPCVIIHAIVGADTRVEFSRDAGGTLHVRMSGVWTLASGAPALEALAEQLGGAPAPRLALEAAGLEAWDSALVAWAHAAAGLADARGVPLEHHDLQPLAGQGTGDRQADDACPEDGDLAWDAWAGPDKLGTWKVEDLIHYYVSDEPHA